MESSINHQQNNNDSQYQSLTQNHVPQAKSPYAIPLIQFQDQNFSITDEAIQFLSKIKNPLGIITIVGKYRTGKSLFLNKVLLNRQGTFKVCPTINSCTKGLWISSQTIKVPTQDGKQLQVLIMDTEGFGAMQETNAYNNKILLFALLLSSYFIYNSVGSIDEKSLNNLNVIVNMAKQIQIKNSNNENLEQYFPSFLWVVRDFSLNLVDKEGNQIQAKQYLEQALEFQKGTSDSVQGKNKIRRMLKHFFKQRDCFTMVRPVQTQQDLQKLSQLDDSAFRSQFIDQVTALKSRIFKKVKGKKMKNKSLNGQLFIQLAKSYIDSVNKGSMPNFQLSWKHLIMKELQSSVRQIVFRMQYLIDEKISEVRKQFMLQDQIKQFDKNIMKKIDQQIKMIKIASSEDLQHAKTQIKNQCDKKIKQLKDSNQKSARLFFFEIFHQETTLFKAQQINSIQQLVEKIGITQNIILEKTSTNPLQKLLFPNHFLPWKNDRIIFTANIIQKSSISKINQLVQKNQNMQIELKESLKIVSQLNENVHEKQKIILLSDVTNKQEKRMMEFQINYLKNENSALKQEIQKRVLTQNKRDMEYSQEVQGRRKMQRLIDQLTLKNEHQSGEIQYVKKELQLHKGTITSRNQQIQQLRERLHQVQTEFQKCLQRQKINNSRSKNQIQSKSSEYVQLFSKYDLLQAQHTHLVSKFARAQAQLKSGTESLSRQKQIYESMFSSFKESMQVQGQSRKELLETNKNLSSALKSIQLRMNQAEERQKQLKQYKKAVKNASCLQCQHCTKFFVPAIFGQHLNVCILGPQNFKLDSPTHNAVNTQLQPLKITIQKTLIKQSDSKPYTEYTLQIQKPNCVRKKWIVQRKYKDFCQLNNALKISLPGVNLSDVQYIVNPHQNSKKTLLIEQRRKILEKYLNNLCENQIIRRSPIWKKFIGQDQEPIQEEANSQREANHYSQRHSMLDKQNIKGINAQNLPKQGKRGQTPEQFFKTWNQRNTRQKQSSQLKKKLRLGL